MSGFLRGLRRERPNPHEPHKFEPPEASRGAISVSGAQGAAQNIANIALANASMRSLGCGVPGCGKTRDDPIHAPEE